MDSLSFSLSIVSGGLTVNSELYVCIYVCICVRACARNETIHAFVEFFRHENAKRSLYAMRVRATSRLNVITDQPDDRISLTLPFLFPPPGLPPLLPSPLLRLDLLRTLTCNRCNRYDTGDKTVFAWHNPFRFPD